MNGPSQVLFRLAWVAFLTFSVLSPLALAQNEIPSATDHHSMSRKRFQDIPLGPLKVALGANSGVGISLPLKWRPRLAGDISPPLNF